MEHIDRRQIFPIGAQSRQMLPFAGMGQLSMTVLLFVTEGGLSEEE
jgi:hypothetical protein